MDYQIEKLSDVTVFQVKRSFGEIFDWKIKMELLSFASYGAKLALDLSKLDTLSNKEAQLLVDLFKQCEQQNARLIFIIPNERIYQIISTIGNMHADFPVHATLEDGLEELQTWEPIRDSFRVIPSYDMEKSAKEESLNGDFEEFDGVGEEQELAFEDETDMDFTGAEKEEINFSAFYPKEVVREKWYTLLFYAYIPSLIENVRKDAQKFQDEIGEIRESRPTTSTPLARETEVTIVPSCEGVTFNPERFSFKWIEDRHRATFRLLADKSLAGLSGNIVITIFVGPLIVGTLKMGLLVHETETGMGAGGNDEVTSQMYHQDDIFISYSHRDTAVIHRCQQAYQSIGFNVLIDSETLRSGQIWNEELKRMIERANIFQLFWSENSSKSDYCQQEWQHALGLKKGEGFIRPVFWKEPMPDPPSELAEIHFDFVAFSDSE